MKTFKLQPVEIPSDMPERIDLARNHKKGFLRNAIAERGKLHEMDEELLAIGLIPYVIHIMEDKTLDITKPVSLERFANLVHVLIFSYATGTMRVTENGDVLVGGDIEDLATAMAIFNADRLKFPNGKSMKTEKFLARVHHASSADSIKPSYDFLFKKNLLGKRGLDTKAAFAVARSAIFTSKKLMS